MYWNWSKYVEGKIYSVLISHILYVSMLIRSRPMYPPTFVLGQCVPWTMLSLNDASLGRCLTWTMPHLDDASLGRCVPWTMRPLDDASIGWCVQWTMRLLNDFLGRDLPWTMRPLDDASLGRCVPWTMRPWTMRPLDEASKRCFPTLMMYYCTRLLLKKNIALQDNLQGWQWGHGIAGTECSVTASGQACIILAPSLGTYRSREVLTKGHIVQGGIGQESKVPS